LGNFILYKPAGQGPKWHKHITVVVQQKYLYISIKIQITEQSEFKYDSLSYRVHNI